MNQKAQVARAENFGLATAAKQVLILLTETAPTKQKGLSLIEIQEGVATMFGLHHDARRLELYLGALVNNRLGQEFAGRPLRYAATDLGRETGRSLLAWARKQNPSESPLIPKQERPVPPARAIRTPSLMILEHLGNRIAQIGLRR